MTRLDEIAARLAVATPGPWETVPSWHPGYVAAFDSSRGTQVVAEAHRSGLRLAANADLIAHAPEDIAALLDIARKAQELRRLWRAHRGRWKGAVADAYDALFDAIAALESHDEQETP